ncbi:MAG: ABC transporter permease [Acidobacteria bacterium]|nr:ABC transporter permease [Acidobacteriota bacterium]
MRTIILVLAKRLLLVLPVVWAVVTLVFLLIHIVPGDPVRNALGENATEAQVLELKHRLGLDLPLSQQYINYWRGVLEGDLGVSLVNPSDRVLEKILARYPATIELALAGLVVAIMISIPLGVTAGTNQGKLIDNIASVVALLGISTPGFVLGPLMVYLFAIKLDLLPVSGRYGPEYLILPAVTLGAALSAILTRMVRSSVIEELNEDYVRTARAKGLSERQVIYKHVLKNGLIPVVTVIGLQFGVLLAGAIITEVIFSWPGLGRLTIDAINSRDYPMVQGCILMIALSYIIANLMTDFAYRLLDPRIKVE